MYIKLNNNSPGAREHEKSIIGEGQIKGKMKEIER